MGPGTAAPRVLHAIPGRLRVHLPGWSTAALPGLHGTLSRLAGVRSVHVNALTENVLIEFEPRLLSQERLLGVLRSLRPLAARVPVGDDGAALRPGDLLHRPLRPGRFGSSWPRRAFPPARTAAPPAGSFLARLQCTAAFLRRLTSFEKVLRILWAGDAAQLLAHLAGKVVLNLPPIRASFRHLPGRTGIALLLRVAGIVSKLLTASPLPLALAGAEAFLLLADGLAWWAAWSG